jgi:hypothetical protein
MHAAAALLWLQAGITFYSWTSDQYSQYGTKVISATVRDATYILDEILDNETELTILEPNSTGSMNNPQLTLIFIGQWKCPTFDHFQHSVDVPHISLNAVKQVAQDISTPLMGVHPKLNWASVIDTPLE